MSIDGTFKTKLLIITEGDDLSPFSFRLLQQFSATMYVFIEMRFPLPWYSPCSQTSTIPPRSSVPIVGSVTERMGSVQEDRGISRIRVGKQRILPVSDRFLADGIQSDIWGNFQTFSMIFDWRKTEGTLRNRQFPTVTFEWKVLETQRNLSFPIKSESLTR